MSMKSLDNQYFSIGIETNSSHSLISFSISSRAAVKIANIDLVFGRMFTDPKSPNERVID